MNFPILSSLILLPTIGAVFILFTRSSNEKYQSSKYVALFISVANFLLSLYLWYIFDKSSADFQFLEEREWLSGFINYKVGIDGISILFVVLTTFITPICIISVNSTIKKRPKDFLVAILIMETFMIGVFCSLDLVIFYLFFEAGLIPMFLIIGIWGGERRVYSAFKFFLYTLLGSVLMLIAIISIFWISGTTDVEKLYELGIEPKYQNLLWLAFFSSFAVKTPMWPVHTWLPDAHVEAPTSGSVILASVLLKVGGYGMIRFMLPITTEAGIYLSEYMIYLSLIAIIYISFVAYAQDDMKKLIAYSSVAHMGFVTLGIFLVFNLLGSNSSAAIIGLEGAMIQMISHGLISAALFFCIGIVYKYSKSRLLKDNYGVAKFMPIFSFMMIFFLMANSGLPGTSGFVGEFLVITSSLGSSFLFGFLAATSLLLSASYSLKMGKNVLFGDNNTNTQGYVECSLNEKIVLGLLIIFILYLGITPDYLFKIIDQSVIGIIESLLVGRI